MLKKIAWSKYKLLICFSKQFNEEIILDDDYIFICGSVYIYISFMLCLLI